MIVMPVGCWPEYKNNIIIKKKIKFQELEFSDRYELYAAEPPVFVWQFVIYKTDTQNISDYENNYKHLANQDLLIVDKGGNYLTLLSPFTSKSTQDGDLFRRVHGANKVLTIGQNNIDLIIPYAKAKINSIELLWFPEGYNCDFLIYSDQDVLLNQLAFGAGIAKDYHNDVSPYDADLTLNMKLRLSLDATGLDLKKVCVNFILHEII